MHMLSSPAATGLSCQASTCFFFPKNDDFEARQEKKYETFGVRSINRTNYVLRSRNPVWNCKIELSATSTDGCIPSCLASGITTTFRRTRQLAAHGCP
jgi:hypothetical protein